jgi:hypothetical protein
MGQRWYRMSRRNHEIAKGLFVYRVIHKSMKHFKNSQQINYASDHGNSYADRE